MKLHDTYTEIIFRTDSDKVGDFDVQNEITYDVVGVVQQITLWQYNRH